MLDHIEMITPLNSTAVEGIQWNARDENLFVTYVSGDGSYMFDDVGWEQFSDLRECARNAGSWGSGLSDWKNKYSANALEQARVKYAVALETASLSQKKRIAKWLADDIARAETGTPLHGMTWD